MVAPGVHSVSQFETDVRCRFYRGLYLAQVLPSLWVSCGVVQVQIRLQIQAYFLLPTFFFFFALIPVFGGSIDNKKALTKFKILLLKIRHIFNEIRTTVGTYLLYLPCPQPKIYVFYFWVSTTKKNMFSLFLDNHNPNLFIYLFVVFGDPPPNFNLN